ncbi:MAG: carbamoyl phosphate synthase small subunit [Clostridia bacterium]|nr:carbamoyl phosphate synthase small subunit [Clostridia bacterium]
MQKNAYLVLENGMCFAGRSYGYEATVTGELVFTTGMVGYLETLTDPAYYGQIVVQTFPLIGNYGVIPADLQREKPALSAYILREPCEHPSNFRAEGSLQGFLTSHKIPAICDIDTRQLTRIIRENGVMNAKICFTKEEASDLAAYSIRDAVAAVSCKSISREAPATPKVKVVLWDFGAMANMKENLLCRGAEVITVPHNTTAAEIAALSPDGILLSGGPGNPAENDSIISEIQAVLKTNTPLFGIGLGHQLLALAQGAKIEKLPYGHRGASQPVKRQADERMLITEQNHGYTVVDLPPTAQLSYMNGNDGSCEGIVYQNMPAFSVQFYPTNADGLYDRFIEMAKEGKSCR